MPFGNTVRRRLILLFLNKLISVCKGKMENRDVFKERLGYSKMEKLSVLFKKQEFGNLKSIKQFLFTKLTQGNGQNR